MDRHGHLYLKPLKRHYEGDLKIAQSFNTYEMCQKYWGYILYTMIDIIPSVITLLFVIVFMIIIAIK